MRRKIHRIAKARPPEEVSFPKDLNEWSKWTNLIKLSDVRNDEYLGYSLQGRIDYLNILIFKRIAPLLFQIRKLNTLHKMLVEMYENKK